METKLKITVNRKEDKEDITYPCLMTSDTGSILLAVRYFSDINKIEGTILYGNGNNIGEYADDWNPEYWTFYYGKVTLEQ